MQVSKTGFHHDRVLFDAILRHRFKYKCYIDFKPECYPGRKTAT